MEAAAKAIKAAKAAAADPVQATAVLSNQVVARRQALGEELKAWAGDLIAGVTLENPQQVEDFAMEVAQRLGIAQQVMGRTSAASVGKQLQMQDVKVTPAPDIPLDIRGDSARLTKKGLLVIDRQAVSVHYDIGDARRMTPSDMTTAEVLKRPAAVARWARSQGEPEDVARERGIVRLDQLIDDNLMLAERLGGQQVLVQAVELDIKRGIEPRVIGYRRVIHSEFSYGGTCGLCITASNQIYHYAELLPIHSNCHCTISPIAKGNDPGAALNNLDLSTLYEDAGGTSAAHLKRTRYKTNKHGELGAVLVPGKPYKARGENQSAPQVRVTPVGKQSPAELARQLLPGFEKSLTDLRASGLPDSDRRMRYHLTQIAKHKAALADEAAKREQAGAGGKMPPVKPPTGGQAVQGDDEPRRGSVDRTQVPRGLKQHEIDGAERLADRGHGVVFLPPSGNGTTADMTIDGETWELKSPHGSSPDSIPRNLRKATSQSKRVVLDMTDSPIPFDEIKSLVERYGPRYHLRSVRVIRGGAQGMDWRWDDDAEH